MAASKNLTTTDKKKVKKTAQNRQRTQMRKKKIYMITGDYKAKEKKMDDINKNKNTLFDSSAAEN